MIKQSYFAIRSLYLTALFFVPFISFGQYNFIEIIGEASPNGDWNNGVLMTQDSTNQDLWMLTGVMLSEGGIKFRADSTWDNNWGGNLFPNGTAVAGGDNINVTVSGTYDITLDLSTNTYSFNNLASEKNGVSIAEYGALVDIYNKLGGDFWKNTNNWMTDADVSEWYGVSVIDRKVVAINLSNNGLWGTIPPSIAHLQYITSLDLSVNGISGMDAPEMEMPLLEELSLHRNYIQALPDSLNRMSALSTLRLTNNTLLPDVEYVLNRMSSLTALYIDNNDLGDTVAYNKLMDSQLLSIKNTLTNLTTFEYTNQKYSYCCGDYTEDGDSTTLFVPYFDDPKYSSFQWYLDGQEITGANAYSLKIKISENLGSAYTVTAVNENLPGLSLMSSLITQVGAVRRMEINTTPAGTELDDIYIHLTSEVNSFSDKYKLTYDADKDVYYAEIEQNKGALGYYFSLKGSDRFRETEVGQDVVRQYDPSGLTASDTLQIIISNWAEVPVPNNTCNNAEAVTLGNHESDGSPNWYKYTATENINIFISSDHDAMGLEVYNADCNDLTLLSTNHSISLNSGEEILISWKHNEDKDVPFQWSISESEFIIISQFENWNMDYAVLMQEVSPKVYEATTRLNHSDNFYLDWDGTNLYKTYNTSGKSGDFKIHYNSMTDSLAYELVKEKIIAPHLIYSTDPNNPDSSYWTADEEIMMVLDLEDTYFESDNQDNAYLFFWQKDIGLAGGDSLNGPWFESAERNKLTHIEGSKYSFTFNPSAHLNLTAEEIETTGLNFLVKTKDGGLKTVDSKEAFFPTRLMNEKHLTLKVNMNLAIEKGLFDPSIDTLDVAGSFNNWGTNNPPTLLWDEDQDGIYTVDVKVFDLFDFGGKEMILFKTRINQSWSLGRHEYRNRFMDRRHELPDFKNTIEYWFDDENGDYPASNFSIDLKKQIHLKEFDLASGTVWLNIYKDSVFLTKYELVALDTQSVFTFNSHLMNEGEMYDYNFSFKSDADTLEVVEKDIRKYTVKASDNNLMHVFNDIPNATVELKVNMNLAISKGIFDPSMDTLDVAGSFNNWGNSGYTTYLWDEDQDGIYTVKIHYLELGDSIELKTRINQSWQLGEHELRHRPNRKYFVNDLMTMIEFWYDNENGDYPTTTFAVNLEREIHLKQFDPSSGTVWLNLYKGLELYNKYEVKGIDSLSVYAFHSNQMDEGQNYDYNFSYQSMGDSVPTVENIFRTYTVKADSNSRTHAFNDKPIATVTVNVNMNWAIEQELFDPLTDTLDLVGNFNNWGTDGVEILEDADEDGIYSTVLYELDTLECKVRINQSWEYGSHELANNANRKYPILQNQETINFWYDNEVGTHPTTTVAINMAKELNDGNFTTEVLYIDVMKSDSTLMKRYRAETSEGNNLYTISSKLLNDGFPFLYKAVYYETVEVDSTVSVNEISENEFSSFTVGEENRTIERWFNDEVLVTTITLQVDMSAKIAQGFFDPTKDSVDVAGTFNSWSNDNGEYNLSTEDNKIYSITFEVDSIQEYNFKFRINGSWNDLLHEFPGNGALNRAITPELGIENIFVYYFNDENIENPEVLLKVNMEHQVALENFDPTVEGVEVRIKFYEGDGFSTYPLILNEDGLYGLPFNKLGTGETYTYKFMYQYPNGEGGWTVFEEDNDRTFLVATGQQTTSVWYNDQVPEERILAVWNVNMQQIINTGGFNISSDQLTMKGSFNNWTEEVTLTPIANGGSAYTTSISLPAGTVYYKLFINGVEEVFLGQDASNNRSFELSADNTLISVVYQFEETTKVEEEKVVAVETEEGTVEVVIEIDEVIDALGEDITIVAMLADGSPLPEWIVFDPETLTFTIDPSKIPSGQRDNASVEDLDIVILANNEEGESLAIEVNLPVDEYISNITSLEDVLLQGVSIYPTLIEQQLNVKFDAPFKAINYNVMDLQGKTILQGTESGDFEIDFINMQSGLYLIQLQNADKVSTFKVIKK
ncbi:T9SS type A sorting domain-containing protein [Flammeovirga aprica]|uniref:T9SS type A sorting domain-containing protein n=1 Tax=Flammeovirga aprica JL-4 TaxID=694437 RepID=A0A7X9RX36_9BACT|nr:T9SS type A sorting domain-containing protein [Flammeovirga aprica]NME70209.1 T9SS type A sorting domain-containing protein [Flammeovirga aprica JL-4]